MGELDLSKVDHDFEEEKKSRCCCSSTRCRLLLIIFGIISIIGGAVAMPLLYDFLIEKIVYDVSYIGLDLFCACLYRNHSFELSFELS